MTGRDTFQGLELMSEDFRRRGRFGTDLVGRAMRRAGAIGLILLTFSGLAGPARAGKISWLDDVVQEVIVEAKAGGKGLARGIGGDGASAGGRRAGRLFLAHNADEGLEHLVR